jgi:hypothetical protein
MYPMRLRSQSFEVGNPGVYVLGCDHAAGVFRTLSVSFCSKNSLILGLFGEEVKCRWLAAASGVCCAKMKAGWTPVLEPLKNLRSCAAARVEASGCRDAALVEIMDGPE